ncbi:MAG TPA: AAA domain-containing protein [Anaeromyxobacteraceae bacterium]|nr:AAA domain-containing protein [Anaeromyxobacteraceae bacterium]
MDAAFDLERHLERMAGLVAAEREEERARLAEAASRLSLAERDARGIAAADVEAVDEGGLAGRSLVTYASATGGPLGAARIGVGSLVQVGLRRERPEDAPTGVVARRSRSRISVAFEEPPPGWATSGRVALELVPSPVTWERLASGVRRMAEEREGRRWHRVLSGEAPRLRERARPGPAPAMNPEQRLAVEIAGRADDLALVHGPPGTGKTTVLVEVIRGAVARGEQVLAAAPSNLAADNLLERLVAAGVAGVRLGHPARVLPGLVTRTLEAQVQGHEAARIARGLVDEALALRREARRRKERRGPGRYSEARDAERRARELLGEARALEDRAESEVLARAPVVVATLTGLDTPVLSGRRFPLAVVDEATQAIEPAAYLALLRAERAVLAGDHRQLPPTVLSRAAQEGGLGVSLFERLAGAGAMAALAEQHRMHEVIMRYPSEALYGGSLRAHPAVAARALDDRPLLFVDTAGRGFEEETPEGSDSRHNPGEAELAAREVERVLALGVAPAEVAVISPYDAQVQRLREILSGRLDEGLEVDTVDGFQGREKDAVVVSLVRSNDSGEVGFLSDVRRMNVAITRARKKLVVVGDSATVCRHAFYAGFVRHAEAVGGWASAWERSE